MTKKIDKFHSTPLVNYVHKGFGAPKDIEEFRNEIMALALVPRKTPPVKWMKGKLGKQKYTWIGSCRYWIWEGSNDSWRVFVNNTKGICFEVNHKLNPSKAKLAWKDFIGKIGLHGEMRRLQAEHPGLFHTNDC